MKRSIFQTCLQAAAAITAGLIIQPAFAQMAAVAQVVNGDDNAPGTNKTPGFSVHKEKREVTDAFEDFERYRDKKAWEKAFGALGKIDEGKPGRLVPSQDGFLIPTELKVRSELLSLPPEGREAYRLFNDAKAAQMLKDVQVSSADEIPALTRLVNRYFITAVGDQAADRLGDALFETGDFPNAERCWQMIVETYPDSSLPTILLQTKRAMALARYGQWDQFEVVRQILHERFAGQKVHLAGQDVVATDFVDKLKNPSASPPSDAADALVISGFASRISTASGPLLPTTDQPAWQIPLMDTQASNQLNAQLGQSGWASMSGSFTQAVPATVVDEKRIYVNWLGICFAADMKTGKLLWRTDTFGDMTQKMAQALMQGTVIDPQIYTATLYNDKVLFTRRATDTQNYNELPMTRLHCLTADGGKAVWKSDNGTLASWGFLGTPAISGDVFYIVAHAQGTQEMSLLCIGIAKGDIRWKSALGTPAVSTNYRGIPTVPQPTLLLKAGKIMVLTNNGALLQVDAGTHDVEWALSYPANVENQQQYYYGYSPPASVIAPGELLVHGPTLYLKEYNTNVLYAMDPAGPVVKWKRRVDPDVALTSFDGKNMLLVGSEVENLDCDSRDLQWDAKANIHTGSVRPVFDGDWMYLFGSKGIDSIRISTGEAGTRFKGYDRDSDGGVLWKTSSRLLTVSSRAITAYPLGPSSASTAPTTAPEKKN